MTQDSEHSTSRLRLAPGLTMDSALIRLSAVRSSGPGGQNVNKLATKVELRVHLRDLPIDAEARSRLRSKASHLVTSRGQLVISSDAHRSQRANRQACLARLRSLIRQALIVPRVRKKTAPSRRARQRRIDAKRQRGQLKQSRRRPNAED